MNREINWPECGCSDDPDDDDCGGTGDAWDCAGPKRGPGRRELDMACTCPCHGPGPHPQPDNWVEHELGGYVDEDDEEPEDDIW